MGGDSLSLSLTPLHSPSFPLSPLFFSPPSLSHPPFSLTLSLSPPFSLTAPLSHPTPNFFLSLITLFLSLSSHLSLSPPFTFSLSLSQYPLVFVGTRSHIQLDLIEDCTKISHPPPQRGCSHLCPPPSSSNIFRHSFFWGGKGSRYLVLLGTHSHFRSDLVDNSTRRPPPPPL